MPRKWRRCRCSPTPSRAHFLAHRQVFGGGGRSRLLPSSRALRWSAPAGALRQARSDQGKRGARGLCHLRHILWSVDCLARSLACGRGASQVRKTWPARFCTGDARRWPAKMEKGRKTGPFRMLFFAPCRTGRLHGDGTLRWIAQAVNGILPDLIPDRQKKTAPFQGRGQSTGRKSPPDHQRSAGSDEFSLAESS